MCRSEAIYEDGEGRGTEEGDPPSPPPAPAPEEGEVLFGATRIDTSGTTNQEEINAAGEEEWFAFHAVAGVSCFPQCALICLHFRSSLPHGRIENDVVLCLVVGHTYQLDTDLETLPDSVMELYDTDGSTLLVENDDDPRVTELYDSYIEWSEFRNRSCSMQLHELALASELPACPGVEDCCAAITLTATLHCP